jgi:anti-sigma factor RsiW
MTDITCTYTGDRDQTLIAYLYDDIEPRERASFAAHLPGCERCRRDLAALGGVRQQLSKWAPPEPQFTANSRQSTSDGPQPSALSPQPSVSGHRGWWREVPAWAQVAAALLFLGVSAGIANLDVRYDANGVSVRTGWSRTVPAVPPAASARSAETQVVPADYVNRAQLAAVERALRTEIHAAPPARATVNDAEIIRRVRALVDESEKRQQRELALRVAQVLRDVGAQRQVDLTKIDRNLGLIQNTTGVEILKQREMVNYLMRVSQRP